MNEFVEKMVSSLSTSIAINICDKFLAEARGENEGLPRV